MARLRAFGRGISLGGALDDGRPGAGRWLNEACFEAVCAAGFNTVRLPVKWSAHQAPRPPYRVDPAFLARVDRAVGAARARDLAVVLDAHHFDALSARRDAADEVRLLALWEEVARRYVGVGPDLCLENVTASVSAGRPCPLGRSLDQTIGSPALRRPIATVP